MFTIRPARNLTRFGFDRADRSVSLMLPRLHVAQMAGAAVRRRPKRLRRLLSRARQVLASDSCGISVICERCQRAGLMRREEMIWPFPGAGTSLYPSPRGKSRHECGEEGVHSSRKPPSSRASVPSRGHLHLLIATQDHQITFSSIHAGAQHVLASPGPAAALRQQNVNESERHPPLMNDIKTSRQSSLYEIKIEHWPNTISHFHPCTLWSLALIKQGFNG